MKRFTYAGLIGKVCLPLFVITIIGISGRPHDVSNDLTKTHRMLEISSLRSAYAVLIQSVEFISWQPEWWENAGHMAFAANDPEIAISFWQQAISRGELTSAGYFELGEAYQQIGDVTLGIQSWERVILTDGPSVVVYELLAKAHKQSGDIQSLISDLRALVKLEPENAQALYDLGITLAAVQPESAIAYLSRAAEIDPEFIPSVELIQRSLATARLADEPAYSLLISGRGLGLLNEWKLAAEAFRRATVLRPDYSEAWAFFGESLQQSQNRAMADVEKRSEATDNNIGQEGSTTNNSIGLVEIEKALTLDPKSVIANTFMSYYWQRKGNYNKALAYLSTAASLEPDNLMLLVEFGNTLSLKGDLLNARIYYQRAVDKAPTDPFYWRMLAIFCIHNEIYLRDIALPAARQAVLLNPIDPIGLDVLAQVYIKLNDLVSAQRFLLLILDINPIYPAAHLHLGQVYLLLGDSVNAYKELVLVRTLARQDPASYEQAGRLLYQYFP